MGDKAVALVTGSGAGIGRGIAIRLASDGYAVILNSRSADPDKPDEGAYEVKSTIEKTGGEAEVCRGDVSVEADRRRMIDFAGETFGRLDLLVNNAGVAPKERLDILEASEESFERVLSINLQGPYFLTQLAARRMIEWKQAGVVETPRICFVSSISAYMSSPNRGEYCVSKAGLSMGAKLFAHRLAEEGIPVVEICPGIIETRMTAGVKEKYDSVIAGGLVPARRWGQPEDIASVVSAFARGDLDFCTGSMIEAGGGIGIQRL
ncbi:MAG: 3-ketoacyl-ACP reductase [Candidatus Sumerlaeota bacterium]